MGYAILTILAAAAAAHVLGAAWYMTLAKPWMAAAGVSEEDVKNGSSVPHLIAALGAVTASAMLWHVFDSSGVDTAMAGLVGGLGVGALIAAPWIVLHYAYAGRPKALWWIDGGHTVAAFAVMGLVLGAM